MILNKTVPNPTHGSFVDFSFGPFLQYLKDCANRDGILKKVIKSSIEKITKQFPGGEYTIPYEAIPQYEELYFLTS